ncbi:hypothetical protein Bca101_042687 [Brassica carinata]
MTLAFLSGGWGLCFRLSLSAPGTSGDKAFCGFECSSPIKRFHCPLLVVLFTPGSIPPCRFRVYRVVRYGYWHSLSFLMRLDRGLFQTFLFGLVSGVVVVPRRFLFD